MRGERRKSTVSSSTQSLRMKQSRIPKPLSKKNGWPWQDTVQESRASDGMPKISIITPSYNQGDYIEETIRSVLLQNYGNLEYIIVDGGSTDQTPEILEYYRPCLTHLIQEPDTGQADAISKGLKHAGGTVFNWLNSDDTYRPETLNLVGTKFKNPSTQVLLGRSRIFGNDRDRISPGTDIYIDNLEKTIGRARIDQPETFFKLDRIKEIGGINTKLHYLMDRELWIRYLLTYGLDGAKKIDDVLANFRLHPNSKTVSQQKGFESENFLLGQTLTGKGATETFQLLRQMLNSNRQNVDVSAIAENWLLQQYQISYSERDFTRMSLYLDELRARNRTWATAKTIINLEARKKLIQLRQKI